MRSAQDLQIDQGQAPPLSPTAPLPGIPLQPALPQPAALAPSESTQTDTSPPPCTAGPGFRASPAQREAFMAQWASGWNRASLCLLFVLGVIRLRRSLGIPMRLSSVLYVSRRKYGNACAHVCLAHTHPSPFRRTWTVKEMSRHPDVHPRRYSRTVRLRLASSLNGGLNVNGDSGMWCRGR